MTVFGKILAFLNLVVGLGLLAWSVSIYTERPAWFAPAPEGVTPGQNPVTFAQLKADIDGLTRTAVAASANWGIQYKALEHAEELRATRLKGYAERLAWTRTGNPNYKDASGVRTGAGFFEPVYDSSGLLDLKNLGPPVKGPDDRDLQGYETLGKTIAADTKLIGDYQDAIYDQTQKLAKVTEQIDGVEKRVRRMSEIRDVVQAEKFFLDTFEVNVYETRETVLRRKRQLTLRLDELRK
jgi:hypothetical protein